MCQSKFVVGCRRSVSPLCTCRTLCRTKELDLKQATKLYVRVVNSRLSLYKEVKNLWGRLLDEHILGQIRKLPHKGSIYAQHCWTVKLPINHKGLQCHVDSTIWGRRSAIFNDKVIIFSLPVKSRILCVNFDRISVSSPSLDS